MHAQVKCGNKKTICYAPGNSKHQSLDNPIAVHCEKQLHGTDPQPNHFWLWCPLIVSSTVRNMSCMLGSKGVECFFRVDCKPILDTEKDPLNSELSTVLELEMQNKRGQLVVATKTQHDPWGAGDLSGWVGENDGTRLGLVGVSDQWGVKLDDSFSLHIFREVVTPLWN